MLGEPKNQFSLTRLAPRRAKANSSQYHFSFRDTQGAADVELKHQLEAV
jgi:hypothetical protein